MGSSFWFAYIKPVLLTRAQGNPGWNPVGDAIAQMTQRSNYLDGLPVFLENLKRGIDPDADQRRATMRGLFYRPPGGSLAAMASHLNEC